jgi:peptide chain release factor 1
VATGRGDPLLQHAHLVGQRRLVAHRGRHPAEQGRDLGAGLGEAEDVVDEQQHVLLLHVAEVLRHRQRRQRDPQARARRLVHLAEHQCGLADDLGLGHLGDEVVALTGALADAGEHRHAVVVARDAGDHLLDQHGLADAAPPNRPILPPRTYGVSRSMTLMPVWNISVFDSRSRRTAPCGGSASAR